MNYNQVRAGRSPVHEPFARVCTTCDGLLSCRVDRRPPNYRNAQRGPRVGRTWRRLRRPRGQFAVSHRRNTRVDVPARTGPGARMPRLGDTSAYVVPIDTPNGRCKLLANTVVAPQGPETTLAMLGGRGLETAKMDKVDVICRLAVQSVSLRRCRSMKSWSWGSPSGAACMSPSGSIHELVAGVLAELGMPPDDMIQMVAAARRPLRRPQAELGRRLYHSACGRQPDQERSLRTRMNNFPPPPSPIPSCHDWIIATILMLQ